MFSPDRQPAAFLTSASSALAIGLSLSASTFAADDPPPFVFTASALVDDESSRDLFLALDYGLGESTWLIAAAGYTDSRGELADIATRLAVLGVEHKFDKLGFTTEYEYWGDPGDLDTQTIRASLFYSDERWRVGLYGERREIDVDITVEPLGRLRGDLHNTAVGAGIRYTTPEYLTVYFSAADYDYSRDITQLAPLLEFERLSASALTLANSFLDSSATLGVEIPFNENALDIQFSRNRTAVDRAYANTARAGFLFPAGRRSDLEIVFGRTDLEDVDDSWFGGLSFFYYR